MRSAICWYPSATYRSASFSDSGSMPSGVRKIGELSEVWVFSFNSVEISFKLTRVFRSTYFILDNADDLIGVADQQDVNVVALGCNFNVG